MKKNLYEEVIRLIMCNESMDGICRELNIKREELLETLRAISENGTPIDVKDGEILTFKNPEVIKKPYRITTGKDHIKLAHISDTHLASKIDDIDTIKRIYDKAEDMGVDAIFHAGDFVDGIVSVPNYFRNLKETTYEGQLHYAIDRYPKYSGKTFAVSGNHDDYWTKLTGKEIIKDISEKRDDIVYLGPSRRIVYVDGLKINVLHGRFKPDAVVHDINSYIDVIPEGKKPNYVHSGHYHTSDYSIHDGVKKFRTSSLMRQSPYEKKRALIPEESMYFVDVYFDDNGNVAEITHEKESFRK